MGCVVSRKQIRTVNIATTPREKIPEPEEQEEREERSQPEKPTKDRILVSSSTIKEEDEDIASPTDEETGNFASASRKMILSPQRLQAETNIKDQTSYFRMESVTARKKNISDATSAFQRRASIRAMRDPSYNEFSFKQSIDSSMEKDGGHNSPRSSSQNIENASNQSGDYSQKFEGLGYGGGLRRTATPNFNRSKPSSFFLEKRNSMRNLRPAPTVNQHESVSSITSIIPRELKEQTPNDLLLTFQLSSNKLKSTDPTSLEDHSFQTKGLDTEFKKIGKMFQGLEKPKTFSTLGLKADENQPIIDAVNVFYKPPTKPNTDTLGRLPKENSLEHQLDDSGSNLNFGGISDITDLMKKASTSDNEIHKPKRLFSNISEKESDNNRSHLKDTDHNISTANTFISNSEILKDGPMKPGNMEQNGFKLSFIKRVDFPSVSGRQTGMVWTDVPGSSKESPTKEQPDFNSKPSFQKKLFPSQLSVHAKFTMNLLDILKDQADDLSPVLPLNHTPKNRRFSQRGNKLVMPTGKKSAGESIDYGNPQAQPALPTNLLPITRQETLPEANIAIKPALPFLQNKLLRRDTHEALTVGSPHALNKGLEQDLPPNPVHQYGRFAMNTQQTMKTDASTINEGRTVFYIEDNISTTNISKFALNFDNEEIEYDEAAGIGVNRPNILNGTLNQDESSIHKDSTVMGHIKSDSPEAILGRKDSISSSNGKESVPRKSLQPNDGFESHMQQLDEASPLGSKPGSRGSIGSTNHIPKSEINLTPHRSIRASVFRTSPRGGQNTPTRMHTTIAPTHLEAPTAASRGLHKAKSCVIQRVPDRNNQEEEALAQEKSKHGKTSNELDTGSNHLNQPGEENPHPVQENPNPSQENPSQENPSQENPYPNKILQNLRKDGKTPTFSKNPEGEAAAKYLPVQKSLTKDLKINPNKGHNLKRTNTVVVETGKLDKTKDSEGQKRINNYILIKDLGRGSFGKVKLAQDKFTGQLFAAKIANKEKLKRKMLGRAKDAAISTLASEIAIMKKLEHPNVVKLYEVIDDSNEHKMYLVMDYIKKGAVMSDGYWKHEDREGLDRSTYSGVPSTGNIAESIKKSEEVEQKRVLSEEKALKYFRELMLGLDYLHNHVHVIHRDIKPENLLIDQEDHLKISDFGVSHIMENESNDHLKNNAGTKFFLPPEAFGGKGFHGKPADVWAAGATLFYFLTGTPPFQASNPQELKNKVMNDEPNYPPAMNARIKEVIELCLKKDPEQRATLKEIMESDWLTEDGMYACENRYAEDDEFKISDQDIKTAVSTLKIRATIMTTVKMKTTLSRARNRLEKKKTLAAGDDKTSGFNKMAAIKEDE